MRQRSSPPVVPWLGDDVTSKCPWLRVTTPVSHPLFPPILPLFCSLPTGTCQPLPTTPLHIESCPTQPCPFLLPAGFGFRVGRGSSGSLRLQELHSWLVTHRRPCDSSKDMLHPSYAPVTHILVRKHVTHKFAWHLRDVFVGLHS